MEQTRDKSRQASQDSFSEALFMKRPTGFFHGTSTQAIRAIKQNRILLTGNAEETEGYIHAVPNVSELLEHAPEVIEPFCNNYLNGDIDQDIFQKDVETYANLLAQRHAFLELLGFDLSNCPNSILHAARMLSGPQLLDQPTLNMASWSEERLEFEKLLSLGFSQNKIFDALEKARDAKGVILGMSCEVAKAFPLSPGDDYFTMDIRIHAPKGIPFSYLTEVRGAEPATSTELKLLLENT